MEDEVQAAKPTVTVAKYGDRIASDQPVNALIDVHGEGSVHVNGKSIAQHLDDAAAGVESDIAEFLHSIAGFSDRLAKRLQAKADQIKADEQAAEAAAIAAAEAAQVDVSGAKTPEAAADEAPPVVESAAPAVDAAEGVVNK